MRPGMYTVLIIATGEKTNTAKLAVSWRDTQHTRDHSSSAREIHPYYRITD